jgi:hypothetical protein
MNCDAARSALLTADPRELRGNASDTPLGAHLASCQKCHDLAARLSADLDKLSVTVVARVGRERRRPTIRRVALIAAIPVAAAAVAMFARGARDETPAPAPAAARPAVSNMVSVDIARGQQATVIRTRDPKVTVIWLSNGGGL